MASHEGKHYKCFLPVEDTKTMKSMLPQNATNSLIESERKIKPKEPDELLEILKDQCFYRVSMQMQFFLMHEHAQCIFIHVYISWQAMPKKTDYFLSRHSMKVGGPMNSVIMGK